MQHFDCRPGQEGSYTVRLAADGETMTLMPIRDDCLGRSDVMTGRWTRWPCPNPDSVCAPELDAGSSPLVVRTVRRSELSGVSPPVLSGYSYIVPAGWSCRKACRRRTPWPGRMTPPRWPSGSRPTSRRAHRARTAADDVEPGVGSSPADLATWLTGPARLGDHDADAGHHRGPQRPPAGRVGRPGVDAALRASSTRALPRAHRLSLQGPRRADWRGTPTRGTSCWSSVTAHTLLIEISAPDEASWNDLVQAGMPIVETFEFTR